MRMWQTQKKHNTQESQYVSPFLAGDHKAERNRQDSITGTYVTYITKMIHK